MNALQSIATRALAGAQLLAAQARSRRRGGKVPYSHWNTHNASARVLRRYIKKRIRAGDVAIGLNEVWAREAVLRKIAKKLNLDIVMEHTGNRWANPVPEEGDSALLLTRDFNLEKSEVLPLKVPFLVHSSNRIHKPRRPIRAVGRVDGQRVELLFWHGPTDIYANAAAVREFKDFAARVLTNTRADTLSIGFGDGNLRLAEAKAWVAANNLDLDLDGWGPDITAVCNGRVKSKRGKKGTSDHYDVAHEATPNRKE